MAHRGKAAYRLPHNPREARFAEAWERKQDTDHTLKYLLGDGAHRAVVNDRDELVAATVIQWLGSPVGWHWLQEVLSANAGIQRRTSATARVRPSGMPGWTSEDDK